MDYEIAYSSSHINTGFEWCVILIICVAIVGLTAAVAGGTAVMCRREKRKWGQDGYTEVKESS